MSGKLPDRLRGGWIEDVIEGNCIPVPRAGKTVRALDAAPTSRQVVDWGPLGTMTALTCERCGYFAQHLNGEPDPNLRHMCTDDEGRAILRYGKYEVEL